MLLAVNWNGPAWNELGPGPVIGRSTGSVIPPDYAAVGAVEALATPPNNPKLIFAGAVNGGVWRTLNGTDTSPTWQPLTEQQRSLSVGALALSHFDVDGTPITSSTPLTLPYKKYVVYAGAGRISSGFRIGGPRVGLIVSKDGGDHWLPLGGSTFDGVEIRSIVPSFSDPKTILVAATSKPGTVAHNAGVWRTTDGGNKWERVFAVEADQLTSDPGNGSRFYVGVAHKGIFRSSSGGVLGSWLAINTGLDVIKTDNLDNDRDTNIDDPGESIAGANRIETSVHNSAGGNVVYAAMVGGNGKLMALYRSTNQGNNWTLIPSLPDLNTGSQGDQHMSLAADPFDPNVVFIGGDTETNVAGNIWRADISKANVWSEVVTPDPDGPGPQLGNAPHPDSRDMVFNALGDILESDDGGVFRLVNPDLNSGLTRAWDSRNGNLRVTEFWSVAYDPLHQIYIGGLQDIGVVIQHMDRSMTWEGIPSGDGGVVYVDSSVAGQVTYYSSSNQLGGLRRDTYAADGSSISKVEMPLVVKGTHGRGLLGGGIQVNGRGNYVFDATLPFVTRYDFLHDQDSGGQDRVRLLIGSSYLYESFDNGATLVSLGGLDDESGDGADDDNDKVKDTKAKPDRDEVGPNGDIGEVTAIAYGGRLNGVAAPNVAYVASGRRLKVRTAIATPGAPKLGDFTDRDVYKNQVRGGSIDDIALDSRDWHKGFVTDVNGDVFAFTNTGTAANDWKRVTGNLNSFTKSIYTCAVIADQRAPEGIVLLVGGQGGVYATLNPSAGNGAVWVKVGSGLPKAVVTDLRYDPSDILYCGTFGRGAWRVNNFLGRLLGAAPLAERMSAGSLATTPVAGELDITGDELTDKKDVFRLVLDPGNPDLLDVFVNNTTDVPDFVIDTAAVNKIVVTGGQDNDTLTIDHDNGLVKIPGGIEFDQTSGDVRQEINQTPIDDGIVSKIRKGLQGLADWGAKLAQVGELAQQLPGLATNIAQTLGAGDGTSPIGGVLQQGLVDKLIAYFDAAKAAGQSPTVQQLVDLLKSLNSPIGNVSFGIDPLLVSGGLYTSNSGHQELRFNLALHLRGLAADLSLDFSTALQAFGLSFNSSGKLDVETALDMVFSFGVDLTPNLSDSDAFFIRVNELTASARVSAGTLPKAQDPESKGEGDGDGGEEDDEGEGDGDGGEEEEEGAASDEPTDTAINAELKLGFLDAQVRNGALELDAALHLNINNPDNDADGNITLAELAGTSINSLIDPELEGKLDVELPLKLSLAGLTSDPDEQPVLKITSDDLFDPAALTVTPEHCDDLFKFNNVTAGGVLVMLRRLGDSLGNLGHSSAFDISIPLTSTKLSDVLDFASSVTHKITDPLVDAQDQPIFNNAQDLANLLASQLGLDPSTLDVHYDPDTQQLTYHLSFAESYNPGTANVDLGLDLSPVANFAFSSGFDLSAGAGADFLFGIYLGQLGPDQTTADRFFIQDAKLNASLSLAATNLTAQAKIGLLGVGVAGGSGIVEASATVELQNPNATTGAAAVQAPSASPTSFMPMADQLPLPAFAKLLLDNPGSLIAPRRLDNLMPGVAVNVSQQPGNQVEPVIVIDPTNPQRMFAASNGYKGGTMVASYSTDGGATWTSRLIGTTGANADGFDPSGADPAAVFDKFGNLYFAYLTADHQKVPVLMSTDGGQTFSALHTIATNGSTIQPPLQDIGLDRPVLASGPTGDPGSNDAAVWLAFIDRGIGVHVAGLRVTGAGSDSVGSFGSAEKLVGSGLDNFPDIAVGPKGQVAVVVGSADFSAPNGPSNINVYVDSDGLGSQTFGTKQLVATTQVGPNEAIGAQSDRKITAAPSIGYAMAGPHVGEMYVVYTDQSTTDSNDTDIVLKYSNADGAAASWKKTVTPVSHAPKGSSQFFANMAIDPKSGNIAVGWYDTRNDTTDNMEVDFYVAVSTDGGRSFGNETRLTTASSDEERAQNVPGSPDPFDSTTDTDFGDYSGIDFFNGDIFPAWADNSVDVPNQIDRFDIRTAKISLGSTAATGSAASHLVLGATSVAAASASGINFSGYAQANLPIEILPAGFLDLQDAAITVDWSDLTDPSTIHVEFPGVEDAIKKLLDSFENLSFTQILAALGKVLEYLKNVEDVGFLKQKLPLIDTSISGLLDYAQKFNDKLQVLAANPAQGLEELETAINDAFGVPMTIKLDSNNNLQFLMAFDDSVTTKKTLNFDLASLLATGNFPDLSGVVNISGTVDLNFSVTSLLNLALGIDLSDPNNPVPFLYDGDPLLGGTGLSLTAKLAAVIPDLDVSIGILSAHVNDGSASIHAMGNAGAPARFDVQIGDDGDLDGRHLFTQDIIKDVTVDLDGAAFVDLPLTVNFPTPHALTPSLQIFVPDLAKLLHGDAGSVQIQTPNLANELNFNLFDNMAGLVDGLDQLLGLLQKTLDSKAFARNLPLVGTHLKDGAQVIQAFRTEIVSRLRTAVDLNHSAAGVREALFNVLGPYNGGLDLLTDITGDHMVTLDDVRQVTDDPTNPDDVRYEFHLRKDKDAGNPTQIPFDLGLPALQLQATGKVDVAFGFDFDVKVGLNRGKGVYFDTSDTDELKLDFGVGIHSLDATASFGFLDVDVTDGSTPTSLTGTFSVDLGAPDDQLTIGGLTDAALSAHLSADANINLGLKVSFDDPSANFPSITSDLHIGWHFDSDTDASNFGNAPQVSFEKIKLDLGSFFSSYASPVLGTIKRVLDPLQPIIDFLGSRVAALEKIDAVRDYFDLDGDKQVTVLEIIHGLDDDPRLGFVDAVVAFSNLVGSIPASSDVQINLGRFDLNDQPDLRTLSNLEGLTPSAAHTHEEDVDAQLDSSASDFSDALDGMSDVAASQGGSFSFPLIQSPSKVFKLLLGQDVDLFRWQLPEFAARLAFDDIEIPIFGGVLTLGFGGSIEVHAQAGFAYDTFGLRQWRKSGNPGDVADGFYLIDKPEGSTEDVPEISALGEVHASAGADIFVAAGKVTASLIGELTLDLVDPNNDGKVRLDELNQNLNRGPLCIFEVNGTLDAQITGSVRLGHWPFDKTFNLTLPRIHLLSFEHECDLDPGTPPTDPGLATDGTGGLLILNMGSFAGFRKISNKTDGDEEFAVGPDPDVPGNILVSAFGFSQSYSGFTSVFADAGEGNDAVIIDPSLNVTAFLLGGNGHDTLQAGAGRATINGDAGDDQLTGGADNDSIRGLAGNDLIFGRGGNDTLSGGDDIDVIYGEGGNDNISGGAGISNLLGGDGNDSITGAGSDDTMEGEAGNDTLIGNAGNDLFHGGDGDDSISGGDGEDSLAGDAGKDTLDGGNNADSLYGGEDDDSILGGGANDTAFGEAGNDNISGGDDQDQIHGDDGNDTLSGDAENDDLFGDAGDDSISGGAANDFIAGGEGNDSIDGGAGNEIITGDSGDDSITAGDGNDTVDAGEGNDKVFAGTGNDSVDGGFGTDSIEGGSGIDVIHGQEDNDTIVGQDDSDSLFGDAGNDSISGGNAGDYIEGGADNDFISGDAGDDRIFGNAGNDTVHGNDGSDTVGGGTGEDVIFGDAGGDSLAGDDDGDIIVGDSGQISTGAGGAISGVQSTLPDQGGNDTMAGGAGADQMIGGFGSDQMEGADGNDVMLGDNGSFQYPAAGGSAPQLLVITTSNPTLGAGDSMSAGAGNDIVMGGTGGDTIQSGEGNDLVFGDHGKVDFSLPANANFVSIDVTAASNGGNDSIVLAGGDDTALGGQGNDTMRGGAGDDDLIGGHNAVGGADGADNIEGGDGNDAIAGDSASIVRNANSVSPRFHVLGGAALYTSSGSAAVTGASQADPAGTISRTITLLDHLNTTTSDRYGNDSIAGGAGNDVLFGGLGNDAVQGDASIDQVANASTPSVGAVSDGDDYIEGNGGADIIFGNGGQDDIIGGSSDLFGLSAVASRPDGADLIFGGSGTQTARNNLGDTTAGGHAADADVILGDNGDIFRIVGVNGVAGAGFVKFNYDNYSAAQKVIVRSVKTLDYTPGTGAAGDVAAPDTVHGEAGDDSIHGGGGNEVLFGEGQDDDLYGEAGSDRMYGGAGEDGMLGDDGIILTSRNGLTEPLNNLTAVNAQAQVTLTSGATSVWTFITGRLFKTVDLAPFAAGGNDLMYGGLADDFMHGGAGEDGMSGAEAQSQWYNDKPVGTSFFSGLFTVADPTSPLGYNAATTKFAAYDASTPTSAMKKINSFFLNFDAVDGAGAKISDGKDRIFGDAGNDWLYGGTLNDRLFGGAGNDVLNADDNLDTHGGLNDRPDPLPFRDADFAFGGLGRDVLLANTGADRLYDWVGEFNNFVVPFSNYGTVTVLRQSSPALVSFLQALGNESGSDRTVTEPTGELALDSRGDNGGPRDPQPGNVGGVQIDTNGGPEDDRSTAFPLTASGNFASATSTSASALSPAAVIVSSADSSSSPRLRHSSHTSTKKSHKHRRKHHSFVEDAGSLRLHHKSAHHYRVRFE